MSETFNRYNRTFKDLDNLIEDCIILPMPNKFNRNNYFSTLSDNKTRLSI